MKLFRFGEPGQEKAGVVHNDVQYDVSAFGEDYNEQFFQHNGLERLKSYVQQHKEQLPQIPAGVRFGPAIARPSKIICIGLNYADHAKETNAAIPQEPIVFFKATSALCGPNDDVIIPKNAEKLDWEVELAVIIGKKASYVSEEDALAYVAGYALHNDYSERAFQLERGGQWVKGKSNDTFAPVGPYLVTPDELGDINNLRLWLTVNDNMMQDGTTANLIFKVPFLISYLSQFMTLLPGDLITTGTPAGVGLGMHPQVYLKEGDVVTLGIDGLGTATQTVKAYED
ncbi:fumarylacetoacetate hydrolase family protein [Pontibacter sp. 172403-2]|uniref:fumarylacetoacetate hydrolase family protein n=1 Tax=Pontibacter rufus TaxID=2791028 RepID=UPI0018AF648C|nr:fumarylacetoacetate hydrolase family protein [Pontibacter sp. 172403-2]MBF9254919.1 fumarylacetoacetate hydrolase family protein [Pontibacter sp. 172403-2]